MKYNGSSDTLINYASLLDGSRSHAEYESHSAGF